MFPGALEGTLVASEPEHAGLQGGGLGELPEHHETRARCGPL